MDRAADPPVLTLAGFDLALDLLPTVGGSIGRFAWTGGGRRIELMRPADAASLALGAARGAASFPLVPFSGRIGSGRFQFGGRAIQLEPNMAPEGHAIHGDGWTADWTVAESTATTATLVYDHAAPPGGWPWRYRAEQRFALTPDGLTVALSIANRDSRPMPAGLGLHPYFPKAPGTRLTASNPKVLMNDMAKLPVAVVDTPPAWDMRAGRAVDAMALDFCFVGWDGVARLDWPDHALAIEADPVFGCLVVYTQPAFFCVEPVSHQPDAVNRGVEAAGLRILEPGQSLAGSVRFRAEGPA